MPATSIDEARALLLGAAAGGERAAFASEHVSEVRYVSTYGQGGAAFVAAEAESQSLDWEGTQTGLTDLLRDMAPHIVYAGLTAGQDVASALMRGRPSSTERPLRQGSWPRGAAHTSTAFEDLFVPDAWPVQFLGAGYDDRQLPEDGWTIERVGSGRLVVARELASPYASPDRSSAASPGVAEESSPALAQARRDLDLILYHPGRLAARGYADVE